MDINPQDLLFKYLSGDCGEEELRLTEQWIGMSDDNRSEFERVKQIWESSKLSEFNPDIDAAWQKVYEATQPGTLKVSHRRKQPAIRWISGIAASLLMLAVAWLIINQKSDNWQSVHTTAEQRIEHLLPDGSRVWLKENTTLGFNFDKEDQRSIELAGEAFFEVAKDPQRPFMISLGEAYVEVAGTSFYVRSILKEDYQVSVKSGLVSFGEVGNEEKKVLLKANEEAILKKANRQLVKRPIENLNLMAWQTGTLVFNKTPLSRVIIELSDHYRTTIEVETEALGNCLITSRFDNQSLEEVLEIIKKLLSAELIQTDTGFILKGQGC